MYRKEVNAASPLRILDESIHGGLGPGNLGVVMARAGVGKTAFIVQIGLDDLLRDRPVLHIALEQNLEHVQSWYDALFDDLADLTALEDREAVRANIAAKRLIVTFADHDLGAERFERKCQMFKDHFHHEPAAILVDGFDWAAHSVAENAALLGAFKAYAKLHDAELWMTAQTHREITGGHPTAITPPCDKYDPLIDVALFLEPHGDDVRVRLLKDHDDAVPPDTHLHLHADTLRLVADDDARGTRQLPPAGFTLLSGGATGAEAAFGECAEAWGMQEITFSFSGRNPARKRGLVNLSEDELAAGAVSPMYIEAQMHRSYPNTPSFRKTLQSIWHQVQTAGEVFSVGVIQPDNTVKGGTGWAAELARHWHKPVRVYDQERKGWFAWDGDDWISIDAPRIASRRFCGTGTRYLSADGKAAVVSLFERSFGPVKRR
jgi:hypothetical protein